MSEQPKGWDWWRTRFAEWFAGSMMVAMLMVATWLAIAVVFIMDGLWAKNQAPSGLELLFMAGGWVIRLWSVAGLVLVVMLWMNKARGFAGFVLVTWLCTSLMSYGHLLGFFMQGQMERYEKAESFDARDNVTTTSVAERVQALEEQNKQLRADRDADVAALERSMNELINDGDSDNDQATIDLFTPQIVGTRADYADQILANNAEINRIKAEKQTDLTATTDSGLEGLKFDPLYITVAGWFGHGESDTVIKGIGQAGAAYLAFLIEFIAGAGSAITYGALVVLRRRQEASDRAKKGHETRRRKSRQSGKRLDAAMYHAERLPAIIAKVRRNPRYEAEGVRDTFFKGLGMGELETVLNTLVDNERMMAEDRDLLLRQGKFADLEVREALVPPKPADPRAPTPKPNGADYPPPATPEQLKDGAEDARHSDSN